MSAKLYKATAKPGETPNAHQMPTAPGAPCGCSLEPAGCSSWQCPVCLPSSISKLPAHPPPRDCPPGLCLPPSLRCWCSPLSHGISHPMNHKHPLQMVPSTVCGFSWPACEVPGSGFLLCSHPCLPGLVSPCTVIRMSQRGQHTSNLCPKDSESK